MASKRCEGRRRKWRGNVFGTFACGRKATHVFQTYTGLTRTHYVCDDAECLLHITSGYPANNMRAIA